MKSKYEILKENIGKNVMTSSREGYIALTINVRDVYDNIIIKEVSNELLSLGGKKGYPPYSEVYIDINHIQWIYIL